MMVIDWLQVFIYINGSSITNFIARLFILILFINVLSSESIDFMQTSRISMPSGIQTQNWRVLGFSIMLEWYPRLKCFMYSFIKHWYTPKVLWIMQALIFQDSFRGDVSNKHYQESFLNQIWKRIWITIG